MSTVNAGVELDVNKEGEDRKLTFVEKLSVVLCGTTGTFHGQVIQMFLLFFYTDIMGVSPLFVAPLFLVTRVVDAFLAPLFGIFIDKITTPWGKYKPWYIVIGISIGVFGWLTFTDFHLSGTLKLVYITITYFLYSGLKTIEQAPGVALVPAVTKRLDDRMSMNQISYFLMMIAAIIAQIAVQPLYKRLGGGNGAKGFSIIMGAVMIIGIIIGIIQAFNIKERYVPEPKKDEVKMSLKEMLIAIFSNKTAVIVYIYIFAINLANGIKSAITIYYLKYFFNDEGLMVTIGAISLLPVLLGVALSGKLTKRIGIRKNLIIAAIGNVVTMAVVIVLPSTSAGVVTYMGLLVVQSFVTGLSTPAQGTMMPAAMDYTEWKTGKNINGLMGSFQGFLQTFATALSGAIAAGSLHLIGYVEGGAAQTSTTIFGFKVLMSIVPAFCFALTLSVIKFDLTEEKQAQITKELAERRKLQAAE